MSPDDGFSSEGAGLGGQESVRCADAFSLFRLFRSPESVLVLSNQEWDRVIRYARSAELLAVLGNKVRAVGCFTGLPEHIQRHFNAAELSARHNRRMLLYTLEGVARALSGAGWPIVLLKGASYAVQDLGMSAGRVCNDVDILVPKLDLAATEVRLMEAGWQTEISDLHDQRYYREWTHELPPMRHASFPMELDVHHTILPILGRARPDAGRLVADARTIPGTAWSVLSARDQVLHAAAHLFQDSDCTGKCRDLADLDGLIRTHSRLPDFWEALSEGAAIHGLGRCLWYALRYCGMYLETPIPRGVLDGVAGARPSILTRRLMDEAVSRLLFPVDPDGRPPVSRAVLRGVMTLRAARLRMPVSIIAYHAAEKYVRRRLLRQSNRRH